MKVHVLRFPAVRTGVLEFLKVHFLRFLTCCSAHRSPRILKVHFLRFPKWVYKTSARKVDKHPALNTAAARSMIKKKRARPGSLGPVQDKARPNAHVILAWVY